MWTTATRKQLDLVLSAIESKTGITPTAAQLPFIMDMSRVRVFLGGERAGKSLAAGLDATSRIPFGSLFWIVGPDYDLPRREFAYIHNFLVELDAIKSPKDVRMPSEGSWELKTKSGQIVMTRTSADVRKLAADPVDGIIITEAAQCSYDTFLKSFGRTSETRGWITLEGTLEGGAGWYAELVRELLDHPGEENVFGATAYVIPTWTNTAIFPLGIDDPEIQNLKRVYSKIPGMFEEKCGAVASAPLGVIFREFSHIYHVSQAIRYDPSRPVYLAIDPGHGGPSAYAVAVLQVSESDMMSTYRAIAKNGEPTSDEVPDDAIEDIDVIDCIYIPGAQTEQIIEIVKTYPWWDHVVGGTIDVEAPDEKTRWMRIAGVPLTARKIPVLEGERRLHSFLAKNERRPSIMFSSEIPSPALREFSEYKSSVSSLGDLDIRPGSAAKARRGADHMLKAIWYFLVVRYGYVKSARPAVPSTLPWIRRLLNHGRKRSIINIR